MTVYYNAQDRKPLVKAISEFTETKAVYMKTPTYAYRIGDFTVTRDGNLEFEDSVDAASLISHLVSLGFTADTSATEQQETTSEEVPAPPAETAHSENVGLTVEIPLENVSIENLNRLLDAKGKLICRALAVDSLPIEVTDSTVRFPWFSDCSADESKAYTHFVSALCDLAANAKRITAKERETDNDKYAFRCFPLRLGFIGSEYKVERKILLRNLTGSSAFRLGAASANGGDANEISE